MSGGTTGTTGAASSAGAGGGFNWQGMVSSPMFQAGLASLASSYTPQGRGGGNIMYGLSAYNQAKQFNMMQSMQKQQLERERRQQEITEQRVARDTKAREEMPAVMEGILGAGGTPEAKNKALASMLKYKPELAAGMLSGAMQGEKKSAFREKIDLAGIDPTTPEGQKAVRGIIENSGTTVNVGVGPKAEPGTVVVEDKNTPSGYRAVPVTGSKVDVTRKEAVQGLKTGRKNVVNMLSLIKKHGSEMGTIVSGKEGQKVAGKMKQMYGETISLIAQLNNLGVLQPGEMKIMMSQLPDPTSAMSYGIGNDRMISAYQQVLERLDRVVSSKSNMLGLESGGVELPEGFQ